jgi:energy-coupling factor transporter ATP-binding protein EcfA2
VTTVRFDAVSFTYPDAARPALDEVTLEIPEGSFTLVTGPTGAGKSTLLRAINGLVPHFTGGTFRGDVTVAGRSIVGSAPRELADLVAFVPQDPGSAFVVDRVEDELAYAMENLGVPPAAMRRRVEETLDLLGIEALRERSVRSLSGGERQRVAIASALTPGPRILVMDEPTSQLDPQGAEDVLAALQRMVHDLGMTVVLAEHRLERVASFADCAIGADAGRFTIGAPRDILARSESIPPVTRLARAQGWRPMPLTVREARRHASSGSLGAPPAREVEKGDALLSARGVIAGYGTAPVLRSVDLEIARGEIVALMGRNGSGKSTLLRSLVGVHQLDSGEVVVGGAAPTPGRGVALCPQSPESILFKDTVLQEVEQTVAWSRSGLDPAAVIRSLGLAGTEGSHPRDLSAGQRLLVAVAATAASGAPLLLLDEPTRGLDHPSKEHLGAYLEQHARSGAVIFATHDVELAAEIANRVVLLANGEVIADGAPGEVLGDSPVFAPQMSRVFGPGWLTPAQVMPYLAGSAT